ncbi:MAG: HEAT repeat domain-containing protein [Bryobacterales bacterium]|nr:HEAT repeat domain-containing protein [Bryobacteraceae bacterium]MDW8131122.1 HEAT repeat domain-containing protein [Bryobacterales bacterium]
MVALRALPALIVACSSLAIGQEIDHPDPKRRARAARELGRQGFEALPRLERLLSDHALEVRIEAVKAIVEIGGPRSLDPLIRATEDNDPEIQIRATDGLVNFYLPGYVRTGLSATLRRVGTALTGRFTDTSDQVIEPWVQVRPDVIRALGRLARAGASVEARANAARAIGILRGAEAIPDLLQAVRSKEDRVIYECLIAFQKIRDPKVGPEIAFLLRDLNERVQIAVIETTGLLRNRQALPQLRELLESARSERVRRATLTAMAMMPDERDRPLFTRHLADRDDGMRAAAAEGLGRLRNAADLAALEKAFNEDRKMPARLGAAFALVLLGKTEMSEFSPLQYLVNTLNSAAWKGVARAYLIELAREAPVRRALEKALAGGTRSEKVELARILAQSGDRETLPYLEHLTRDPDAQVQQEAFSAVRTLKARFP